MNIEEQIADYKPYNEQEAHDQAVMRQLLATQPDLFTRENQVAHMTASSWLLNATHDKVLMIYHNIYHSWAWTGGHADGDRDLLAVAKREAMEETGVTEIRAISEDIFSLEILTVDGHEKRGVYVPSHLHLNVSYLLCIPYVPPKRSRTFAFSFLYTLSIIHGSLHAASASSRKNHRTPLFSSGLMRSTSSSSASRRYDTFRCREENDSERFGNKTA